MKRAEDLFRESPELRAAVEADPPTPVPDDVDDGSEATESTSVTDSGQSAARPATPAPSRDLSVAYLPGMFDLNDRKQPRATLHNFSLVLRMDRHFRGLRYNTLAHRFEIVDAAGKVTRWTPEVDAEAQLFIEEHYHFHSQDKFATALMAQADRLAYNPLVAMLNSFEWDGRPRIGDCLRRWMKCEDTPYTREVSRLIFAGGIHRAFNPGCKFDCMPVLCGKQGSGKSKFIAMLAVDPEYSVTVTSFDPVRGAELIAGRWIAEVEELSAIKSAKAMETVKGFITRQVDTRRVPYARYAEDFPRSAVLIGSTNERSFLSDRTGARRFFPVVCGFDPGDLFDHLEECQEYIKQCWAEARCYYESDDPSVRERVAPHPDWRMLDVIREEQKEVEEIDPRADMIASWLDRHPEITRVCTLMLFEEALEQWDDTQGGRARNLPTQAESRAIASIMDNIDGWERAKGVYDFKEQRVVDGLSLSLYGKQRYWRRVRR